MRRAALLLLAVILAVFGGALSASAAKRVALVIGNSSYEYIPALKNPKNDAEAVATTLSRLGYEVVKGIDLDHEHFAQTVRDFSRALVGADTAVVFYAGHGLRVADRNYLAPIDAKLENEADLDFEMVQVETILAQMEREPRVNIVLLDACRDNPLARNLARTMGTRSAAIGRGLARIETGIGTLIAFATQPGNVALDGEGDHSPFTAALLGHMETPGLDIALLMRQVRQEVIAATAGKQVPWDNSSLTDDFAFNPAPSSPQAQQQVAAVTPPPAPVAPPPPVEPAVIKVPKPEASEPGGDPVVRAMHKAVDERSKDGVFAFRDPKLNADLKLSFEKVNLVRNLEGYGLVANANFHDKGNDKKHYAVDFWFKPDGSDLKLMDIRIQKGPKQEGDSWGMITRMPMAWWWLPTPEKPGDAKTTQAWQVMSVIHDYIATNRNADGNLLIKDDKTGKTVPLEFVDIHQPVRHVKKTGQYFLCTDFRKPGSEDEYYDIDFWVDEKKGELQVAQVKMHQVPVQESGIWTQVPRYNFGNLKFDVIN
jgi:Caspase domain